MKNFNSSRVFRRNTRPINPDGRYVLYWMQINRRFHYNFALEYAVAWANKLNLPLLIFEALSCDYPWATARTHTFIMQGMKEHLESAGKQRVNYVPFVERMPGQYRQQLMDLAENASVLVTDEYPVFIMRERNTNLPDIIPVSYITVDSNGLIPLGLTDKEPYNAYLFRKIVQKNFVEAYTHPPDKKPLKHLKNRTTLSVPEVFLEDFPPEGEALDNIPAFVAKLDIRHDVKPIEWTGSRQAGLGMLGRFIRYGLPQYALNRNDPDANCTSRLSPWLHFGKLSSYEIVRAVLKHQPAGWDLDNITFNGGSSGGFFNGDPNIEHFLDELITWRETGFHFAHHRSDYDRYESLPEWVLETLKEHEGDSRPWIYRLEQLERAETHDRLWNAAQRQLRETGTIHNYLRMLWGKKVIEWTPDPETALQYLIDLNNFWAIDGRDPNSYSGIFWCFGRFDRAWQERAVFGKVRYMSSERASKKVNIKEYIRQFS